MTEITRVPLQPIAKGALGKLWLGVAAAALAAGGLAWATLPKGVEVDVIKAGTGPSPTVADVVQINYKGMLENGKVFDQGERAVFPVEGVIPGFTQALEKMQKGGKYKVEIPSELAYGPQEQRNPQTGTVEIPANSDLVFEIELLDFKSRAEVEAQMRMMQQLQQQMQAQGGGAAKGAPQGGMPQGMPPQPQ
ncbi:MAG: FKBP-type peptidyl-prolyl cis-trans isomerase [Novosphingobium sp.]|jgi:FKBP-type peptidyl-prolyl cis-trans isomerase FkpA|uniref:FKBP-type peptidyl-prolyl cis-trans isomerase n=1 Tax=Novosphingobium sp. TaxID=1874826 RepID=UPI00391B9E40|nr:FKBP-type peptidyl-prolyl cis-trans isomerase [Novosphingobium sp.]